jgi:adenosylcobinamide-GDP ribazoletransferase
MKDIFLSLIFAFNFLTRMPIRTGWIGEYNDRIIANSVMFFPVVGVLYGFVLFFTAMAFKLVSIPVDIQAVLLIALPYVMNRFLHFDGLCDVFDAFLADKSKTERLGILKDSRIGSFALGSAVIFMLLKFSIMKAFISINGMIPCFIIIPVFSRYSMTVLAFFSKYPRENGTASAIVGKISMGAFLTGTALFFLIIAIFTLFISGISFNIRLFLICFNAMAGFIILFGYYSRRKIGGVTGDVLGAANEIVELIILSILVAVR